jgi:hypothetical protein
MFGSSKRHVFKPTAYGSTRSRRRIPRWLVLMFTGVVLGSGGLLFLQKSYGPIRLTVEQSEQLHYDLNSVNMDKQRLQSQLNQQTRDLTETRANLQAQATELKKAKEEAAKLTADLQLFVDAMPPDPRGTSPGIRAASFEAKDGQLDYLILVMQDEGKTDTFTGQAELTVAGRYPNGKSGHVDLPAFKVELQRYTHLGGGLPLPEGFTPRQVTIKIMRDGSEKTVATRTIRVAR